MSLGTFKEVVNVYSYYPLISDDDDDGPSGHNMTTGGGTPTYAGLGKFGATAYTVDADGEYSTYAGSLAMDGNWSIGVWFNPTIAPASHATSRQHIIDCRNGSTNYSEVMIAYGYNNPTYSIYWRGGGTTLTTTAISPMAVGVYHLIGLTSDTTNNYLYIDGALITSQAVATYPTEATNKTQLGYCTGINLCIGTNRFNDLFLINDCKTAGWWRRHYGNATGKLV